MSGPDPERWATDLPGRPPAPPSSVAEGLAPDSLVVTVDTGERIHFLDWGPPAGTQQAPLILLVHGLAQTGWAWAPVARRLLGRCRVITPDLRGHGHSEAPVGGYALDSLAYDMLTVAEGALANGPRPPVVVAGHGFGALVAAAMARVEPELVAGVALVDGGWEDVGAATGLTPAEFIRAVGDPPEVLRSMAAYLEDRRAYDPATWDADQERAARSAVDEKHAGHVAPVARRNALSGCVDAMFAYDPVAMLGAIDLPLLVAVAGGEAADDEVTHERNVALADVVRVRAAPTRVVRFPGAGHNLMRYRADELSAELLGLVELVTTSGGTRDGRV